MVQGGGAAYLQVVNGVFSIAATSTAGQYTIERTDGNSWAASDFAVGQELMWGGVPFGGITKTLPTATPTP